MSFASTRLSTFAFLLGVPIVHAVGCTAPERHYEPDLEGGTGQGGTSAQNGGTGMSSGKGGQNTSGTGTGTAGDGAGQTGEGGDVGTTGGTTNGGKTGSGGRTGSGGSVVGEGGVGGGEGTGGDVGEAGAGGVGGDGSGGTGTGGTGTGGIGTGGILNTGGVGGVLSGGATSKGGATSGGATAKGGASSSGGATSGGATSKGGSGGTGGTTTCTAKAEVCNNNLDDDCDGHVDDCIGVTSTFPDLNGAAAGKDVQITVNPLTGTGWKFQCRSARGTTVPTSTAWADCQTGAGTRIVPRTTTESSTAANNGLWTTQMRGIWPDNAVTDPVSFTYYMHSSLHTATRCAVQATDQQFFQAGAAYVRDAGVFGTATQLRSPFIQLGFTPPVSTYFSVASGQGQVKLMSLRRRFFRSADDRYVLMTRTYASSRSGTCSAIGFDTHETDGPVIDATRHWYDRCAAVVFNHAGAAACLTFVGGVLTQPSTHVNSYTPASGGYSPVADNFAWRKLLNTQNSSGGLIHFSRKCTAPANCTDGVYLPDRTTYFSYF